MTKKEQIYEIAKYVCNACEFGIYRACRKSQTDVKSCSLALGTARRIYNAGYRKIDDLETENKQLKTECALLDDELRIARQDTIDVLNKLKDYVNQLACDEYGDSACDTNYVTIDIDKYEQDIDEMIEEIQNAEDKS